MIHLKEDPPACHYLSRIFGSDRTRSQAPSESPARPSAPPQPSTNSPLADSMAKVTDLEVRLGQYFLVHPIPANKALVDIAHNLGANNSALLYILGLQRSEFGEVQIEMLLKKLQGTGEIKGFAHSIVPKLKESLQNIGAVPAPARAQLREQYGDKMIELLNMYYDVGRKFLLEREMKDKGFSDAEIDRAVKADAPNVF